MTHHPKVAVLKPVGEPVSNDEYIFAGELFVPRGLLKLAEARPLTYYLDEFRRQRKSLDKDILPVLRIVVAQLKYLDTKTDNVPPPNYSLDVSADPGKKHKKPTKQVYPDVYEVVHTHQYSFPVEVPGRLMTSDGFLPDGYYKLRFNQDKGVLKASPPVYEPHEFFFGYVNIEGLDYNLYLEAGDDPENHEVIVAILGSTRPPLSGTTIIRSELRPGQKKRKKKSRKQKKNKKKDKNVWKNDPNEVYTVTTTDWEDSCDEDDDDDDDDDDDEERVETVVSPCITYVRTPSEMLKNCCANVFGIGQAVKHHDDGDNIQAKLAENEDLIGILVMRIPLISRKLGSKKYLVTALTAEAQTNFYPKFHT